MLSFMTPLDILISLRIVLAALAGITIGFDREINNKAAGIRTLMLISVGSALLSTLSVHLRDYYGVPSADPARLMAQIVAGIGFVGGGVILKSDQRVYGVTTAATIWVAAAVGIAIGAGFYVPAFVVILLVLLLKPLAHIQFMFGLKKVTYLLHIPLKRVDEAKIILDLLKIQIDDEQYEDDRAKLTILSYLSRNKLLIEKLHANKISFELVEVDE